MVKRSEAIECVNSHLGRPSLNGQSTRFASKNKGSKSVWWLTIPLQKTCKDLHILLKRATREQDGSLVWLKLPANTLSEEKFSYRQDKDAISLEIGTNGANYLKDIRSGGTEYDFSTHVVREFPGPGRV